MFRTLAAAALLVLASAAAQADSTVRFGDLNPANASDAQILSERVQAAAQSACSTAWGSSEVKASMFYRATAESCASGLSHRTMSRIEAILDRRGRVASN